MAHYIQKYFLQPQESNIIVVPKDAKLLSAHNLKGEVVIYALINSTLPPTIRYDIRVYGVRHIIPIDLSHYTYLNTVRMLEASVVFHVFFRRIS
ncbi:DUF7352 domain-containing protein [Evansella cellulosilytica]|uniref:DUF7352 domain-containing protein n=1 Tax=Evansella cellulosilytica (strain ATCC 21833 / DSM 2522 / FERM P-1141 / JCM 9156 / N-4) TaxID=649639 RepID=E6TRY7_EVAC2|nr:hypothetical protein [Evansella cellulosilytica]ADU30641.1 hypothetical protein Bcell_2383 [Evansella cellulosilytica DSM 2522]